MLRNAARSRMCGVYNSWTRVNLWWDQYTQTPFTLITWSCFSFQFRAVRNRDTIQLLLFVIFQVRFTRCGVSGHRLQNRKFLFQNSFTRLRMDSSADMAMVKSDEMEDFRSQFTNCWMCWIYSGRAGVSGPFSNEFVFIKSCKHGWTGKRSLSPVKTNR